MTGIVEKANIGKSRQEVEKVDGAKANAEKVELHLKKKKWGEGKHKQWTCWRFLQIRCTNGLT
jgi:hypothetical protein